MKNQVMLTVFLLLIPLFIFIRCDNGLKPDLPREPREYRWTVDTLRYENDFQTMMFGIWGTTHENVYAAGHASNIKGIMWNYNGKQWSRVPILVSEGGPIDGRDGITSIYGFSDNDIWVVGLRQITTYNEPGIPDYFLPIAVHYNGSSWTLHEFSDSSEYFNTVWGDGRGNIWAGGWNTMISRYDGSMWHREEVEFDGEIFIRSIRCMDADNVYAIAVSPGFDPLEDIYHYFLKRDSDGIWRVIDSFLSGTRTVKFGWTLWASPSGRLYSVDDSYDGGLYVLNGGKWTKINGWSKGTHVFGSSDNNIFTLSNQLTGAGGVFHYNGSNSEKVEALPTADNIKYDGGWTDGKEAFIIASTDGFPMVTLVFHGK